MGCYHFHLNQLSRGKGQSAIASAAYRAGAKLECTYYGEVSDYTRKGGVVLAEIHLPKQAPERFKDRETLWNEVEWIEGNKKAQLAHSFDIALMNEFSMEENIELARRFVEEQLVARGMIADLAIHDPKKAKDKIPMVHEGPNVQAMEARGISTALGSLNRLIRALNDMKERAKNLLQWSLLRQSQLMERMLFLHLSLIHI